MTRSNLFFKTIIHGTKWKTLEWEQEEEESKSRELGKIRMVWQETVKG